MKTYGAVFRKRARKGAKSIRFLTTSDIGFHQVEKPYKTKGKLMISRVPFRQKAAFGGPADANLTEFKKGPT